MKIEGILKNLSKIVPVHHGTMRKGMVFIPDISGFTKLVCTTDLVTGQSITYELLSTIIHHNMLHMNIAEIEGDAIFFFKWQSIPSASEIKEQFYLLKCAFDEKLLALEEKYSMKLDLQLKAIAHYGWMSEFYLGGFQKLYGEVVIEAHRLLKNSIPQNSYLLITDALAAASEQTSDSSNYSNRLCESYYDLPNICYSYLPFDEPEVVRA